MRTFILILGSLEALFIIGGVIFNLMSANHTDAAGRGLAQSFAILLGFTFILFLAPALLLAYFSKLLWLALIMLILTTLCLIVAMVFA